MSSTPAWIFALATIEQPWGVLLFLLISFGHGLLTTTSHNWWYGQPLNRYVTDFAQLVHGLVLLAGPVLLWWVVGLNPSFLWADLEQVSLWRGLALGYILLCLLAALIIFPIISIRRALHDPKALACEHVATFDIAGELGYKPVGRSKYRALGHFPGNQIFQVDFRYRMLTLPRLPAEWHGLSILHLSDLHFCGTPDREYYRRVVDLCANLRPDLIALTGDYVDSDYHHRWVIPMLGRLQSEIATFAILGNHDQWHEPERLRRRFRRLRMHMLGNSWERIDVRGQPLIVIGNEAPWFKPGPDLSDCPEGFRLCLSHTPDNLPWAKENDIDLMLSGHVHGGQIRIPGFGSVVTPSRFGRKYDCGVFEEGLTVMHVSRGLGGKQPIRLNCRPEVALLTLLNREELA